MSTAVVVGSGVVGLLSAILLKRNYDQVLLIEKAKTCGGLLSSINHEGYNYDFGTHVPTLTNNEKLDEILFGDQATRDKYWQKHEYLITENYFSGQWNENTALIDARSLPEEDYKKGLYELLHQGKMSNSDEAFQYCSESFGKTFTDLLFRPTMKKFTGAELEDLDKMAIRFFGLERIVCLTPEISNKLKELESFDDRLGFHNSNDKLPPAPHMYPKGDVGVGYWIDFLVESAKKAGVEIINENSVTKISHENRKIQTITTEDKKVIEIDHLVWTVPPFLAFKASGLSLKLKPPTLRTTSLFHFSFDKPLLKQKSLYLWCFDEKFKSFRITLYPNIRLEDSHQNQFGLTVEVLSTQEEAEKLAEQDILQELVQMDIVNADHKALHSKKMVLPNTFPVPDHDFRANVIKQANFLNDSFSNFSLLGRHSGKSWFVNEVVNEVYQALT